MAKAHPTAFDEMILSWRAPEYLRFARGWLWFFIMAVLDGLLLAYAYQTGSLTMLAVFLVLPFVLILEHRKKPKLVEVVFSPYGLKFGALKLPYSDLRSFWIVHSPPYVDELHIVTNKKIHHDVMIPLMGVSPSLVRQFLVTQLPEWEGKKLSFMDTLVRFLRLN